MTNGPSTSHARQTITLGSGMATAQSFNALAYILAARVLGPSQFGLIAGALGIAQLVMAVGDLGLNGFTLRALSADPSASAATFHRNLSAKLTLSLAVLIGWLAASALLFGSGGDSFWAVASAGLYASVHLVNSITIVPLRARLRLKAVALILALEKAACVGLLVVLLQVAPDGYSLGLALAVGSVCSTVCAALLLEPTERKLRRPTMTSLRDTYAEARYFAYAGLVSQAPRADTAIVAVTVSSAAAGIYGVVSRVVPVLTMPATAYQDVLYPRLSSTRGKGADAFESEVRSALVGVAILGAGATALFAAIAFGAQPLIEWTVGSAYLSSVPVLRIFCVAMVFATVHLPLIAILLAAHDERFYATGLLITVALGLGSVVAGSILLGAVGAALGMVVLHGGTLLVIAGRLRVLWRRWSTRCA